MYQENGGWLTRPGVPRHACRSGAYLLRLARASADGPGGIAPRARGCRGTRSPKRPPISAKRIPQCVYSVYETGAFAAAVAGLPGWPGLACVRAGPAHPATATVSSAVSTVAVMDSIPHLWFVDPAPWTAVPSPRFRCLRSADHAGRAVTRDPGPCWTRAGQLALLTVKVPVMPFWSGRGRGTGSGTCPVWWR